MLPGAPTRPTPTLSTNPANPHTPPAPTRAPLPAQAELGRLDEAGEVFGEVQAAVASSSGFLHIPDLYVNLANCALAKQEYVSALRLYRIAADKLDAGKRAHLLLYLARAHYDCDDLPAARADLLRAIHVFPTNYQLRFNVALTMQASVACVCGGRGGHEGGGCRGLPCWHFR